MQDTTARNKCLQCTIMDSSGSTIGGTALQKNNGSWIPLVSLLCLLLMRWICYSNGNRPVQIRRWFNAKVRYIYRKCMPIDRIFAEVLGFSNFFARSSYRVYKCASSSAFEMIVYTNLEVLVKVLGLSWNVKAECFTTRDLSGEFSIVVFFVEQRGKSDA